MKLKFRKPSDYESTVIKMQMKKFIKTKKEDRFLNTIVGLVISSFVISFLWYVTYMDYSSELSSHLSELVYVLEGTILCVLTYNVVKEITIHKLKNAEYKVTHGVMVNRENLSIAVALTENLPEEGREITSDMLKDKPVLWVKVGVNQVGLYQPLCPCVLVSYGNRNGLFDRFDCYPIVNSRQLFYYSAEEKI